MYQDYGTKGVQFYYVYKHVQHPEINNYVSAFTLEERLMHVAEAKRLTQTRIPWLCDSMDDDLKHALDAAPNGEFVIDPDGKIVRKRYWSNPRILRTDLEELVGPVDKPTLVADLDVRFEVPTRGIASGVVPRLDLPAGLRALKTEPIVDREHPYYVKIRAEATPGLLRSGSGSMYVALHLDPLYQVHWNNRAGRVRVEISPPSGIQVTPLNMEGPEVKEDADVDPRQFLIEVDRGETSEPIDVSVHYVACDDAETFCLPVTQRYRIFFERDSDSGSRPGIFMPEMFANVRDFDKDGDGQITPAELPKGQVTLYIGHIDYNGDEVLDREEVDRFLSMFNNGRGFDTDRNDGSPTDRR